MEAQWLAFAIKIVLAFVQIRFEFHVGSIFPRGQDDARAVTATPAHCETVERGKTNVGNSYDFPYSRGRRAAQDNLEITPCRNRTQQVAI